MIHAYLPEIGIQEQHGPNFKAKMKEINCIAGTNITVRHNYMKWWRCTGTCRKKPEKLFGYIFRLCTETPGPKDSWWTDHRLQCYGSYKYSAEPDSITLRTIKRTCLEQKKLTNKNRLKNRNLRNISTTNDI